MATIDESVALRNIQLKTVDGVPVNYDQVKYIDVPAQNGKVSSFMGLTADLCYYATMSEVGDKTYFTIAAQWIYAGFNRTLAFNVTDVTCTEYGKKTSTGSYNLIVLITHKQLEIGKTYSSDEL